MAQTTTDSCISSKERKAMRDHERYLANADCRRQRQREYYRAHTEQCRLAVKKSKCKRFKTLLKEEVQ